MGTKNIIFSKINNMNYEINDLFNNLNNNEYCNYLKIFIEFIFIITVSKVFERDIKNWKFKNQLFTDHYTLERERHSLLVLIVSLLLICIFLFYVYKFSLKIKIIKDILFTSIFLVKDFFMIFLQTKQEFIKNKKDYCKYKELNPKIIRN